MKRFAIHNTGEWVRNNAYTSVFRDAATVQEFDTLDGMHAFDRAQFEWMLEHGEPCISMGATVYQICKVAA